MTVDLHLRRRRGARVRTIAVDSGEHRVLRLDTVLRILSASGRGRVLTPNEFRIVMALLDRRGQVVRRDEVVALAWFPGAAVRSATLDAYLHRIRCHLEVLEADLTIETVRGVGWVLH
ncbi:winged helix-turn-helix domain-containing protein [uncultured Amnibacterium sp.]|uniref:winged helix-turn-helix domain-containing protein n=1 Tax=uncultured Amnibacterium sp. TaxID=1631851 RepID=UPI0035CA67E6